LREVQRDNDDGGSSKQKESVVADNRHVVPYNAALLMRFNCHVNIMGCSTVKVVKYVFKYIFKVCRSVYVII